MLTKQQAAVIVKCKQLGYGYARFAMSVEKTGRCTERQFETMTNMLAVVEYRRTNPPRRSTRQTSRDAAFADYAEGGDY